MRNNLRRVLSFAAWCLCCFVAALPVSTALAGSNSWTAVGPDGANVIALAIDPATPSTAYAGTVGSGVLKTVDGGANWSTANAGLPIPVVSALAIDPSAPSTLYAGTDAGVFKSTDGGQRWDAANSGLVDTPQATITVLAIDPVSPAIVYAVTPAGVFKTNDGATNWMSINVGLAGLTPRTIAIDPTLPSTIYVGVDDNVEYVGNGVFKSTDAGSNWVRIYTTPIPFMDTQGFSVAAIAVDPRSPSRLYLALAYGGLLRSMDAGEHWSSISPPQTDTSSLAIDPASSATLYAGTYSGAVFRTTDAGDHWTSVPDSPLSGTSINGIATAASAPAALYAFGRTGVVRSSDGGETWMRLTLGVKNIGVYLMAVDPIASSTLYTALGAVVTKTTDGGTHWDDSHVDGSGRWVDSLVIDPVFPSTLYAGMASAPPVYKSTDAGTHWVTASNGLPEFGDVQALAIAPSRPSTLYVGVAFAGVSKSADGGSSWAPVNNGLTAVGIYVSALAVDSTNADIVYVATPPTGRPDTDAKIFKSTNGAAQWRQIPIDLPKGTLITSLVVDPATPSNIYAAYADYATGLGGVFKSSDSGETWTAPQDLLPAGCCIALTIDPSSPSRIYAATQGGIFRSTDAATRWTDFDSNLPTLSVSSISIDRTGTLLRAATAAGLFEYRINAGDNHTGLWGPAIDLRAGWGINIAHQGDTIVATWFTYDLDGKPAWLVVAATKTAADVYSGIMYLAQSGSPFNAVPFDSGKVVGTPFGTVTFTFADDDNATVAYTVSGAAQTIQVTRRQVGTPMPTCTWGAQSNLALATNFQGLWWATPAGAESGWSVSFTHQGDTIVAVWFTFGLDGQPLWLIVAATRTGPNVYAGKLFTAIGPDFDSNRVGVTATEVGTATFTFADGNNASFAYTVNDISQTKQITREVFIAPGTVCQ